MSKYRVVSFVAFLLVTALVMVGAKCPSIPAIKDRVVELAVAGSTTVPFEAEGSLGVWSDESTVDLSQGIDIVGILDDAGIDVSAVKEVKVSGLSYRVTVPDPDPTKAIFNSTITIQRGSGPETNLIVNFAEDPVNAVVNFKTVVPEAAGTQVINDILAELLLAAQEGRAPENVVVTGRGNGEASPGDTHFFWELKIAISIVGEIETEVLS